MTAQQAAKAEQEKAHTEAAAALAAAQVQAPDVVEAERQMLTLQEEENKIPYGSRCGAAGSRRAGCAAQA